MKLKINGEYGKQAPRRSSTCSRNWACTPRGPSWSATGRSWSARPTGRSGWPRATSWNWCAWWGAADGPGPAPGRVARADLYVVITAAFCAGRSSLTVLDQVLAVGVGICAVAGKGPGRPRPRRAGAGIPPAHRGGGVFADYRRPGGHRPGRGGRRGATWGRRTCPWARPGG